MGQIMEQYFEDALKAWNDSESRNRRALNQLEEAENKIAELERENRELKTKLREASCR